MKTIKQLLVYMASALIAIGILNSFDGVNLFNGHKETYYNRPMRRITQIATENGIPGEYWERKEDGVKMFGPWVICAAHYGTHPYGSTVDTSLGTAIVLDTGAFANTNTEQIDIATTW